MTFDSPESRGFATRRLRQALAVSLLLHLLLFWPDSPRLLSKETSTAFHATMRQPPLAPPADRAAPRSPQTAVAPAPSFSPPAPKITAPPLDTAPAISVPAAERAGDAAATASAPAAPAAPQAAAAVAAAGIAPAGASSGEAADGLRGYRLALAVQARRFKRYPAQAMAAGWTGTVEVRVEVGSDGRARAATVLRSSGFEMLDRAALAMIDAAAPHARLPDSLRGRAFAVALPVVFDLDEE